MKTAKEMFEELGYKTSGKSTRYICYRKKEKIGECYIEFDLKKKVIENNKHYSLSCGISVDELQAINKQVEELGWNNE